MVPKAYSAGNILVGYRDGFKDLKSITEMLAFHRVKLQEKFTELEKSTE